MNHLELFSGTHSFGKVSSKLGFNVFSLDRDLGDTNQGYTSTHHIKEDILTWDYKVYPRGHFKIITASPVCLWWSALRNTWIGRKLKAHGDKIITKEILQQDIEDFGIPMVDKVFEIIDYFNPEYYLIENPQTGKMKDYIPSDIPFYDVDYCRYSDWGYKKRTRFWTNIEGLEFTPCGNNCDNMIVKDPTTNKKMHSLSINNVKYVNIEGKIVRVDSAEKRLLYKDARNIKPKKHQKVIGGTQKGESVLGKDTNKLERYRIPKNVIEMFFNNIKISL